MDFLETLKQDPNCLYIYNWGPYIYGLEKEPTEYLIVVNEKWTGVEEFSDSHHCTLCIHRDDILYHIYTITSGFTMVLNGALDCGICACLNKKFIIKEHVKLMMTTNPLTLRKTIDANIRYIDTLEIKDFNVISFGEVIRNCKFANQIIDNHKIINFKEANSDYKYLKDAPIRETFNSLIIKPYDLLKTRTDGILRRSKIEKILQKEKKNG